MKRTRSPVRWLGGKARLAGKFLELLPPHKIYVEPFGGAASLLMAKEPSPVEVYNDLDSGLVNFFRVLRDQERCARLHMLVSTTPYSREEYEQCLATWRDAADPVDKAHRWFVVMRMCMSGIFANSFGYTVTGSARGMAHSTSSWTNSHELLGHAHARLIRVQVEHRDFRQILGTYDTHDTLFYVDPPYVASSRRSGSYEHEMDDNDHHELVQQLIDVQGKVLLSGYHNDLYKPLETGGWQRIEFNVTCTAAGRTRTSGLQGKGSAAKQARTECLWISPRAQQTKQPSRVKAKRPMRVHAYRPMRACA